MRHAGAAFALALAGCAVLARGTPIEVREAARSPYCNTPTAAVQVALLAGAAAVHDWQAARGITLADADALPPAPYAVVEMGLRSTGGYGLAIAPQAALRDGTVVLQAAFSSPAPGSLRTQALSSPCALVQLPAGSYAAAEVRDASGKVHARSDDAPAPAAGPAR